MDDSIGAAVVAVTATLLTVVYARPQLQRLRATGDVAGVSASTVTLSVAAEGGWMIYLAGQGLWSAMPESVLTVGVNVVLGRAILRAGVDWHRPAVAGAGWAAVLIGSRLVGGPAAIGLLLSVTYAVELVPSVWSAWREWCPSGVAPGTWTLRLVQSGLWAAYGMLTGDRPLSILGGIGVAASAAVLARLVFTRTRVADHRSHAPIRVALPSSA